MNDSAVGLPVADGDTVRLHLVDSHADITDLLINIDRDLDLRHTDTVRSHLFISRCVCREIGGLLPLFRERPESEAISSERWPARNHLTFLQQP